MIMRRFSFIHPAVRQQIKKEELYILNLVKLICRPELAGPKRKIRHIGERLSIASQSNCVQHFLSDFNDSRDFPRPK